MKPSILIACIYSTFLSLFAAAQEPEADDEDRWAPWIEEDYPFFSSVLDLRHLDGDSVPNNITPRGLILNLGHGQWACFDTELLRISAIWSGKGVTPAALAPLSYQQGSAKTQGGQTKLAQPHGRMWLYNGVYPGWQAGPSLTMIDPRPAQPTEAEPGRGPLSDDRGRFKAVRLNGSQAILEYSAGGAAVEELITAANEDGSVAVTRHFRLAPCSQDRWLILGISAPNKVAVSLASDAEDLVKIVEEEGLLAVRVASRNRAIQLAVTLSPGTMPVAAARQTFPNASAPTTARWSQSVSTKVAISGGESDPYVIDHIDLPTDNPWRRNVRLADVQFFAHGEAAGVTLDGDVWKVQGLETGSDGARWHRFASGLHEPMSLTIRDGQIFVFDRNGVWRLVDTDGDGEADRHELFCNSFTQSAEAREFPNSIKLAPDGSFVVSKGGQQASTISRLNGSVLRVAPDGRSHRVLGVGFRQPFVGVHPQTGLVTACDQEGQYIPTTPLHIVRDGAFHGFLSELLPRENYPAPIAEPLTWVPHSVNPSGASQVWLAGAKLGPLNDSLVHLGFNRPEIFRVLFNKRSPRLQAAVVSIARDFDVPALNAAVNPIDGCLYIAGFQITAWGTTAKPLSALARLRYTGVASTLPNEIAAMDKGILVRFDVKVDPHTALEITNYSLERWNYQRTHRYGSAHYKSDGSIGQDWITPSSVYLSQDSKAVFIGVPEMTPVMQMRLGWSIQSVDGIAAAENAYFTPYELTRFDPIAEGFGTIEVDLTPRSTPARAAAPASAEEGHRLYSLMGCMACHDSGITDQPKVGPSWKGLFGKERDLARPESKVIADEAYLRESILDPSAKIVRGYQKHEAGMPVYAGVLSESQIESLLLYIKSLQ